MIHKQFKLIKISILCLVIVMIAGCGPASDEPKGTSKPSRPETEGGGGGASPVVVARPVRPGVRPAWQSMSGDLRIEKIRAVEKGLEIDLLLEAGGFPPDIDESFAICLPQNAKPQAELVDYRIGERMLYDETATTTTSMANLKREVERRSSLEFMGYARNWPVYKLVLKRHFLRETVSSRAEDEAHHVTVRLAMDGFEAPAKAYSSEPLPITEPVKSVRELLAQFVVNPEDMDRFKVEQPALNTGLRLANTDPRPLAGPGAAWARVAVEKAGLYRLDPSQLVDTRIITSPSDLGKVLVVNQGKVVPVHVKPSSDGNGPGGVYFHAWEPNSKYSQQETYWISSSDTTTTHLQVVDTINVESTRVLESIRRTQVIDRDNELKLEMGDFLSIRNIDWYDEELIDGKDLELTLELQDPVADPDGNVQLTIVTATEGPSALWTNTGLRVMAGGQELGDIEVRSDGSIRSVFSVPLSAFADNQARISLTVDRPTSGTARADDAAGVWFDHAEWAYDARPTLHDGQLLLDNISVPEAGAYRLPMSEGAGHQLGLNLTVPIRKASMTPKAGNDWLIQRNGATQVVIYDLNQAAEARLEAQEWPEDLLTPTTPVDYVIITHPEFAEAIEPIAELQKQRGLHARIVDVNHIYDLFGDGDLSPEAIRGFLAWTTQHWPNGGPTYALLVGDASADYLGKTKSGVRNFVPTYTYAHHNDNWASDYWFGCVQGNDELADFLIGRFSVSSVDEANAVVEKTLEYARASEPGPWRARMVYVADNFESFRRTAEEIRRDFTPNPFEARRVYLDEMPLEDNWYLPINYIEREYAQRGNWMKVSGLTTNAIKQTFDEGLAYLEFFGHGSPNIWTDERIWFGGGSPNRDNQYLEKTRQYAFIVNYTCNSGAFDYPRQPWNICISEDLMRQPGGGAVGMLVPSGPGSTDIHKVMAISLRRAMFTDNVRGFGALSVLGRWHYLAGSGRPYMAMMYQLLGDPATRLNMTQRWETLNIPAVIGPDSANIDIAWPLEGMEQGRAMIWIESEGGLRITEPVEVGFKKGRVEHALALPEGLQFGERYRMECYAWDAKGHEDAVASAVFEMESPKLTVADAQVQRLGQEAVFTVTVENDGRVDLGNLPLEIERLEGGNRKRIAEQSIALKAGETRAIEIRAALTTDGLMDLEGLDKPAVFNVFVTPRVPASDLSQPAMPGRMCSLMPEDWLGIVPQLGSLEMPVRGNANISAVVLAMSRPSTQTAVRLVRGDGEVTTGTLDFVEANGGYQATSRMAIANSATQIEQARIELLGGDGPGGRKVLESVALESLPQVFPRLRIVPNSIQHEPQAPTDGQTIFITFEVENIGRMVSGTCRPTLHGGDPMTDSEALPIESADKTVTVSAMGPGRRKKATLRWDPVRNAGVQEIWIALNTSRAKTDAFYKAQNASYQFYVKSKSDLSQSRFLRFERNEQDVLNGRLRLVAEVVNSGETEAKNVQVTFYSQPATEGVPDDKYLIGELTVDQVAPKSRKEETYVWEIDPNQFAPDEEIQPSVIFRLKGSSQRIIENASGN